MSIFSNIIPDLTSFDISQVDYKAYLKGVNNSQNEINSFTNMDNFGNRLFGNVTPINIKLKKDLTSEECNTAILHGGLIRDLSEYTSDPAYYLILMDDTSIVDIKKRNLLEDDYNSYIGEDSTTVPVQSLFAANASVNVDNTIIHISIGGLKVIPPTVTTIGQNETLTDNNDNVVEYMAGASDGTRCFFYGGRYSGALLNKMLIYDPETDSQKNDTLDVALAGHTMVQDESSSKFYIFQGYTNEAFTYHNGIIYTYTPDSTTLTVDSTLFTDGGTYGRALGFGGVYNNYIYMFCGINASDEYTAKTEIARYNKNTKVYNYNIATASYATMYSGFVIDGTTGYIIGGSNGQGTPTKRINAFDFETQTMTASQINQISYWGYGEYGAAISWIADDTLFVSDQYDGYLLSTAMTDITDDDYDKQTEEPNLPGWSGEEWDSYHGRRVGGCVAQIGNSAYIFGGRTPNEMTQELVKHSLGSTTYPQDVSSLGFGTDYTLNNALYKLNILNYNYSDVIDYYAPSERFGQGMCSIGDYALIIGGATDLTSLDFQELNCQITNYTQTEQNYTNELGYQMLDSSQGYSEQLEQYFSDKTAGWDFGDGTVAGEDGIYTKLSSMSPVYHVVVNLDNGVVARCAIHRDSSAPDVDTTCVPPVTLDFATTASTLWFYSKQPKGTKIRSVQGK